LEWFPRLRSAESQAGAAFANGCAANGIDTDDGARYAYGHAGARIFPTALALAEARELNGKRLLSALVVGYEVARRLVSHIPGWTACEPVGKFAVAV